MKLQKATSSIVSYPTRQQIKPILLSATVAMALTACTPHTAGKMPNKNQTENQESNNSAYTPTNQDPKIEYPENVAGGMPVFMPEPNQEQNNTWNVPPQE